MPVTTRHKQAKPLLDTSNQKGSIKRRKTLTQTSLVENKELLEAISEMIDEMMPVQIKKFQAKQKRTRK